MKKCPKWELNWIQDTQDLCDVCRRDVTDTPPGPHQPLHDFPTRDFIIKNSISSIGIETGYDFYDLQGKKLGVVFATHDKKNSPAFGKCEMCFYSQYEKDFRRYHRFKISGERMDFEVLKMYFETHDEKRITID